MKIDIWKPYMTYVVLIIIFVVLVILALVQNIIQIKELVVATLPLAGTFLGAMFAFRLNENKEARKLLLIQRQSLNRSLFILIRQANAVRQLKEIFDTKSTQFEQAFNVPAVKSHEYTDLKQNFTDLEFLLESADPQILFKLTIEQERFDQTIESYNLRNKFYVEEVQPAVERLALNGKSITLQDAKLQLGERIFGTAMNGAKNAVFHINSSAISIPLMHADMLDLARTLFVGERFIQYKFEKITPTSQYYM